MSNITPRSHDIIQYNSELDILNKFLKCNPVVSKEDLIQARYRPIDFRFKTSQGIVGIELTEFVEDNGRAAQREQFLDNIVNKAHQIFLENNSDKLYVLVSFLHDDSIRTTSQAKILSCKIAEEVTKHLDIIRSAPFEQPVQLFIKSNTQSRNLVKINVFNIRTDAHNPWFRIKISWIRQNPFNELQRIINKKEQKLPRYRTYCDKIYLLISANRDLQAESVHFDEELTQHVFTSQFDKVFFFDIVDRQVFELRLSNTSAQ